MKYDFRLDILRDGIKIGEALAESARITFKYSAEVMKGIQFDMKDVDMSASGLTFDMFTDRIRPVLIRDGVESSLGIYMVMAAPQTMSEVSDYYSIEGYDETMIVKQAAFETRTFYAAGTNYLTIIQNLLTSLGFSNVNAQPTSHTLAEDLEAAVGDNYLEFINSLLDAINYQHLYADASGALMLRPITDPAAPEFIYRDNYAFNIIPPIELNTDIYNLPNVVIGVYSSPDQDDPIIYKKVNDDPMSIISTVRRGYKVVQKIEVWNIASQAEMEAYVDRIAFEAMQTTQKVSFTSIAEAGHEPDSAIQLDTGLVRGLFVEKEWQMNISQTSFTMSHTAERKVFV